jgi:hypothetical protein
VALSFPHTRKRFVIDEAVRQGLLAQLGLDAEVLRPDLTRPEPWEHVARRLLTTLGGLP